MAALHLAIPLLPVLALMAAGFALGWLSWLLLHPDAQPPAAAVALVAGIPNGLIAVIIWSLQ